MKSMRRGLCFFLALIMAAGLTVGCSQKTADEQQRGQESVLKTDATTGTGSQEENVAGHITMWGAWEEDGGPSDWISQFNEKYPEVKVEYVKFTNTDEGNIKIDTSLLSGQGVDVFFSFGGQRVAPRAEKGLLQDLTPYLEKDGMDIAETFGAGTYTYNGKYVALPIGSIGNAIWINEDAFKEAGIEVPDEWTIEEYEAIAKELTKGQGDSKIYGSCDSDACYYWTMPARGLLGTNAWYNADGMSNFDNPAYKQALEFKYRMENINKIQIPYFDLKSTKMYPPDALIQKKAAMIICATYAARYLNDLEKYPRDFRVTWAPLPTLQKGQQENYNKGIYQFDYLGMGVNVENENRDAAWTFMKWLATDGSINIAKVGHIPTWKKTNKDEVVKIMLGNAIDTVDIEAFKKYVLDYDSPCYNDSEFTAYAQIYSILQSEGELVLSDEKGIDQALKDMKTKSDEAIQKEKQ